MKASPGGIINDFWDPVDTTSQPHPSTGNGMEPKLLTASTNIKASLLLLTALQIPSKSCVTPVEVSL